MRTFVTGRVFLLRNTRSIQFIWCTFVPSLLLQQTVISSAPTLYRRTWVIGLPSSSAWHLCRTSDPCEVCLFVQYPELCSTRAIVRISRVLNRILSLFVLHAMLIPGCFNILILMNPMLLPFLNGRCRSKPFIFHPGWWAIDNPVMVVCYCYGLVIYALLKLVFAKRHSTSSTSCEGIRGEYAVDASRSKTIINDSSLK